MKKIIRLMMLPALLVGFGTSHAYTPENAPLTKIGVVDWAQLQTKAPQAEEAYKRLEKEFQPREAQLVSKTKEFQEKQQSLQRDREILSDAERSKKEKELSKMQQDLRHMDEELRSDHTAKHHEETETFVKVVREVIDKLAQEEKFDLILPQGATLYMGDRIDITDKILQRLSKAMPAKSDKSDSKVSGKSEKSDSKK